MIQVSVKENNERIAKILTSERNLFFTQGRTSARIKGHLWVNECKRV